MRSSSLARQVAAWLQAAPWHPGALDVPASEAGTSWPPLSPLSLFYRALANAIVLPVITVEKFIRNRKPAARAERDVRGVISLSVAS